MKTSQDGLDLIKRYEGWSPTVYKCPAGIPTIGYGSTWDMNGNPVTMEHPAITEEDGDALLLREVGHVENAVAKLVKVTLRQGQFDALVSFAYNLGSGNLRASTLLRKVNAGDVDGAASEFPKWRKAAGLVLPGLVRRRAEERAMFLA